MARWSIPSNITGSPGATAMAAEGVPLTHQQFLKTFGLRNDAIIPQWIPDATPERIDANRRRQGAALSPVGPGRRTGTSCPAPATGPNVLPSEGWRQAIASSAPRENVDVVLAVIGLAPYFQAIVSAEDVTLGKPDPQVFLTAAARLGSAPGAVHCRGRRARRNRSRAPRRNGQHRSPPQWLAPTRRPGSFAPSPTFRPTPSPASYRQIPNSEFWILNSSPSVYNWKEGADKSLVPRITLHVWVFLTSACYRYGIGAWHARRVVQGRSLEQARSLPQE